jgi:hypothetical protein
MLLADWREGTTANRARQQRSVLCVILPFITIPGVIERIFPSSQISYVSLIPRLGVSSPCLMPNNDTRHAIPLLSLHFGLVQAYWSTQERWGPWTFLEDDFSALRQRGFCFTRNSMETYTQVVESAASQFADSVEKIARTSRADAIVVYGRGHWTMNAAAFVAADLSLPLYVVERGVLPNSYVVDENVPFTAPGSRFRSLWDQFRGVEDWERQDFIGVTESRWRLYTTLLKKNDESKGIVHQRPSRVLVGQCLFDYNCLGAPFASPVGFVEYILGRTPEVSDKALVTYRPHPLSPEEYPHGTIETQYGPIPVNLSDPWEILRMGPDLYTWNSTLGLEAALVFDLAVNIFDPQCHYSWTRQANKNEKRMYTVFLNEMSALLKGMNS